MKSLICKPFFLKTSELSVFHPFIYFMPLLGINMDVQQHIISFLKFKTLLHPQEKMIIHGTPNLPLPPLFFFALQILELSTIKILLL